MRARLVPVRAALLGSIVVASSAVASCVFDLAPLEETQGDGGPDASDDHAAHDARADHHDAHHDAPDADDDAPDDHVDANPCGNGTVDPGEACDDDGGFCVNCEIPCDQSNQFRDPTTRHCYGAFKQGMDYTGARLFCESQHATLAIIKSDVERQFVEAGINAITGVTWNQRVWLGAHKVSGVWTWVDGTTLGNGSGLWAAGEPDGKYDGMNGAACLGLDRSAHGLDDVACTSIHDFVCEYVPPPQSPDAGADGGDGG